MRLRQFDSDRRRAREFESFVAGAAGRLLHAATLLTGEPPADAPRAQTLLTAALAATYADWNRLRGEDPYNHTRQELVTRYLRGGWRGSRRASGGVLGALGAQERVVLVLRLCEGTAEEQVAALIDVPVERVRTICARAVMTMWEAAHRPLPTPQGEQREEHQGQEQGPGQGTTPAAGATS